MEKIYQTTTINRAEEKKEGAMIYGGHKSSRSYVAVCEKKYRITNKTHKTHKRHTDTFIDLDFLQQ